MRDGGQRSSSQHLVDTLAASFLRGFELRRAEPAQMAMAPRAIVETIAPSDSAIP